MKKNIKLMSKDTLSELEVILAGSKIKNEEEKQTLNLGIGAKRRSNALSPTNEYDANT